MIRILCYKNQERDLFSRHDCERAIWLEYLGDRNGNRVPDPEKIGIRAFDDNTRLEAYKRQHGVCPLCGAHFELGEMEADHITPWRDGGRTIPANCQMLCRDCNRRKGAK